MTLRNFSKEILRKPKPHKAIIGLGFLEAQDQD
jgi:hypothetical protein